MRRSAYAAASVPWAMLGVACLAFAPALAWAQAGLTRDEVLRLPPPLRAAASDFGAVECDAAPVVGLLPGETVQLCSPRTDRLAKTTGLDPQ